MTFVRCGSRVHHFEFRPGAARAPALLFIHALGTSHHIWDELVRELRFPGPVVRYDLRGHGLSEIGDTPYDVGALGRDALGLLDQLGLDAAIVCGLSVGGLVAQELALSAPSRVRGVILCGTAARIGTHEVWQTRIEQVRAGGIASVADVVIGRWFTPAFREREPDVVRGYRALLERTPLAGYLAMIGLLDTTDLRERVRGLTAPALVITGELDQATTPDEGRTLASLIPGARFELLPGASHICSVEKASELAARIDAFIEGLGLDESGRPGGGPPSEAAFERGLAVRRAVLGSAHVDRALAAASDFDRDFQSYITRAAWGEVWTRPGLSRRTRHLLTIALLAAQGHEEELGMHLRATINTGVTPAEVREALLQLAVYAGVPAANSAIRVAKRVFAELDAEKEA